MRRLSKCWHKSKKYNERMPHAYARESWVVSAEDGGGGDHEGLVAIVSVHVEGGVHRE